MLLIKQLCAFGLCRRALLAPPNATALAVALQAAAAPAAGAAGGRGGKSGTASRKNQAGQLSDELSGAGGAPQPAKEAGAGGAGGAALLGSAAAWRLLQLQWVGGADGLAASGLRAAHVAAFLLEDEALEAMLLHAPGAAAFRDARGRTPLHYATHGSDRLHSLVYLFTPQPFHTWLGRRSRSLLEFAPPRHLANLSAELEEAQLATLSTLLAHGADPAATDARGATPLALAAAAGAPVRVLRRLLNGAADGAALLGAVDQLGRSPDQLAAAAGQREAGEAARS